MQGSGKHVQAHDLCHTCGSMLRAPDVSHEDPRTIPEYRDGTVTTHYRAQDTLRLHGPMEKLLEVDQKPAFYVVRGRAAQ